MTPTLDGTAPQRAVPVPAFAAPNPLAEFPSEPLGSSFRDPAGYVFRRGGEVFRRVSPECAAGDYRRLMDSGLYDDLIGAGLLLPHGEVGPSPDGSLVLRPEQLGFVSYPYEWSFSQLKDAALLTLEAQRRALSCGMSLKDASAYNVQFRGSRPVLIDTLSFEAYREGEPWPAYRQFCQHFLAPLALMSHVDVRLGPDLLRSRIDGVPADLAARLLPWKTRLKPHLYAHLHLPAGFQRKAGAAPGGGEARPSETGAVGRNGLCAILDSLDSAVRSLEWRPAGTVWGDYYGPGGTNYTAEAMFDKERLVAEFLAYAAATTQLGLVWDLGANDGRFSRLAAELGALTVAWDIDPAAVEKGYREARRRGDTRLLPLLQDLSSPSPDLGWALAERDSLLGRGPADCVMALALVHHLAIGNNVPLGRVSAFLAAASRRWLVVEWVPREDSQTKRLLAHRPDVFPGYTQEGFEAAFAADWSVEKRQPIPGTERTLYLLRRRRVDA